MDLKIWEIRYLKLKRAILFYRISWYENNIEHEKLSIEHTRIKIHSIDEKIIFEKINESRGE